MATGRLLASAAVVVIVTVYAVGSGRWVAAGDAWYRNLERPSWQPPDVVFGLVWPYNFVALVAAGLVVAANGTTSARTIWLIGLAASVAAALTWARLFYVEHALWAAALALVVATVVTVPVVVASFATRTWAGAVLVPYNVWLALATSLSVRYAQLA